VTQAGIEPATFRFVAQHLNRCAPLSVLCGCFLAEPSYVHHSIKRRTVSPVKVFPSLAPSKSPAGFMGSAPPGPQITWFIPVRYWSYVSCWLSPRPIPPVTPKLVYPEGGSVGKSSFLDRKPMKRIGFYSRRPHDCQYTYCEELALIWTRTCGKCWQAEENKNKVTEILRNLAG